MEALIQTINQLRQISTVVGHGKIELPQIVVVGSQSSGKSSVLEAIVGWDFLPRGNGIVTRRPLELNLVHFSKDNPKRMEQGDYATFLHKPYEIFTDFEEVRNEIEEDTKKIAGSEKNISKEPINLTIYSDKVIDLGLVDLPGAFRFTEEDQSSTIIEEIDTLIQEYLKNPKALILAVTNVNTDVAHSDALHYVRKYDPEGIRTLCVLTKLDIMDKGTNAFDLLTGRRKIAPNLCTIGVVNRSQADIDNNKSIKECFEAEKRFFLSYYPSLASVNGREYLVTQLNKLLINHIAKNLPELRVVIDNMAIEQKAILKSLGQAPTEDDSSKITTNRIIRNFAQSFCNLLEGTQKKIETKKLVGGSTINKAFRDFSSYKTIEPNLSQTDYLNALRNSHGTKDPMWNSEHCFVELANSQIELLKEPSINFVDTIKNLLLEIVEYCTNTIIKNEKNRFPRLYNRINQIACDTVNDRLQTTMNFVEEVVDMHLNYINTRHPEFNFHNFMKEASQMTPSHIEIEKFPGVDANQEKIAPPTPTSTPTRLRRRRQTKTVDNDGVANLTPPPDNDELLQCHQLKKCVTEYYKIVCNSLQFMLPKAIMMKLVNHVKDHLHEELEKAKGLLQIIKEVNLQN